MQCPSCRAQVSETASTCAVCGATLARDAAVAHSGPFAVVSRDRGVARSPEPGVSLCRACGSRLEREASFCSECGTAAQTGEYASPPLPPDASEDDVGDAGDVVELPETLVPYLAEDPGLADALAGHDETFSDAFEDDVVVPPAPEPAVVADRYADEPKRDRTGPIQVVREASPPAPAENPWAWVPPAAAAFAIFALLIAMLVHVFAPSSLPDYSAAELSLKIQMRAIEWLLAGTLIALVGMLARR